jgi:methionine synthase II (cobalamin-independent)
MSTIQHLPLRAEHIGSYLRPQPLLEKRKLFEEKKCSLDDLKAAEDEAIKHVVQLQRESGVKSITDGEQRRCVLLNILTVLILTIETELHSTTASSTNSKA